MIFFTLYRNICNWFVAFNNKSKIIINPNDANNFPKFYLLWHYGRDSMGGCYIIKNAYRFTVPKTQQILENRSNFPQKLVFTIKYMIVKAEEFNGFYMKWYAKHFIFFIATRLRILNALIFITAKSFNFNFRYIYNGFV